MADTPRRIDIGFQGGQSLPVRVAQEVYDAPPQGARRLRLRPLVRARRPQDSDVYIDLSQVVYVRLDTEDHRVGF